MVKEKKSIKTQPFIDQDISKIFDPELRRIGHKIPSLDQVPKINEIFESIISRYPKYGESSWDFYLRQSNYMKEDFSEEIKYIINEIRDKKLRSVYDQI